MSIVVITLVLLADALIEHENNMTDKNIEQKSFIFIHKGPPIIIVDICLKMLYI